MTSEDIAEVAVVGIPDTLKGQIPLGLCVLKHGRGLQLFIMFINSGYIKYKKKIITVPVDCCCFYHVLNLLNLIKCVYLFYKYLYDFEQSIIVFYICNFMFSSKLHVHLYLHIIINFIH